MMKPMGSGLVEDEAFAHTPSLVTHPQLYILEYSLVEDAGVKYRLSHALDFEEVAIVRGLPDAAGVGASHVTGDPNVVGGTIGSVSGATLAL